MNISSVGKKIGIAAGIGAAAGLTALAYVKGKANVEPDKFVNSNAVQKAGMAIGEGYKAMGKLVAKKAVDAKDFVVNGFKKFQASLHKTAQNVEE